MISIFSTGDRESDIVLWHRFKKDNPKKTRKMSSFNCSEDNDLNSLLGTLETVSFFANDNTIVCHNVPYSKKLVNLLATASQDIYIITMSGRWGAFKKQHSLFSKAITLRLKLTRF